MPLIFGYLSLLRSDSVRSSVMNPKLSPNYIPAKMDGYVRSWTSYRKSGVNETKNYVTRDHFKLTPIHTWATLKKSKGFVNGICFHVDEIDLGNLDAREIGYQRIDVTNQVHPYDGFSLKDEPIYTYIAPSININSLPIYPWISADYVNMGFEGATSMDKCIPGFYQDYVLSTLPCEALIKELRQVFWSYNGLRIYLLNEKDSSVILLHDFLRAKHPIRSNTDIHYNHPITESERDKDSRNVESHGSGVYFEAMKTTNLLMIDKLIDSSDPWLHVYTSKNPALTPSQEEKLKSNQNFIVNLILEHKHD